MDKARMDRACVDRASGAGPAARHASVDDDLSPEEPLFLAEVAAVLADWPARNQVVRKALDHACGELLRLAQCTRPDREL